MAIDHAGLDRLEKDQLLLLHLLYERVPYQPEGDETEGQCRKENEEHEYHRELLPYTLGSLEPALGARLGPACSKVYETHPVDTRPFGDVS